MASDKRRYEELDRPAAIIGMVLGCGLLALNVWVFTLVY